MALKRNGLLPMAAKEAGKFSILAIIAFIADTIGIGSYAVVIAGCKMGKLLSMNGYQALPMVHNLFQVLWNPLSFYM